MYLLKFGITESTKRWRAWAIILQPLVLLSIDTDLSTTVDIQLPYIIYQHKPPRYWPSSNCDTKKVNWSHIYRIYSLTLNPRQVILTSTTSRQEAIYDKTFCQKNILPNMIWSKSSWVHLISNKVPSAVSSDRCWYSTTSDSGCWPEIRF